MESDLITNKALSTSRFLVVDDDPVIAEAVKKMLLKAGAEVDVIHSAEAAMETFDSASCDVVVTDLVMEGSSGLELLKEIRERDSSIGVVLMTSHAAPDIADQARDSGANGFLRKPFKIDACITEAVAALSYRRQQLGLDVSVD